MTYDTEQKYFQSIRRNASFKTMPYTFFDKLDLTSTIWPAFSGRLTVHVYVYLPSFPRHRNRDCIPLQLV